MATPIKRIEKDFLLKALYDEQLPLIFFQNRVEYTLSVEKPTRDEIFLKSDRPMAGIYPQKKMDLIFDYRGKVISFKVTVKSVWKDHLIGTAPEFLYKDLDRSFSRVPTPQNFQVQFTFLGDRYSLAYPKVQEYEEIDVGQMMSALDPKDITGLVTQIAAWIKTVADEYQLHVFKDLKSSSPEEQLIAETGKSLFLPSTLAGLPQEDPYPKKRLITQAMFLRHLESTGVEPEHLNTALARFIRGKFEEGIFSDLWVPILFREYVIGHIHLWINREGKAPLNYEVIDTLYQFSKIFAFSLKENGYFESGRLRNDPFEGKVIDISASGVLFAYPRSDFASSLGIDSELLVKLSAPKRVVSASAKIVRHYQDRTTDYFGCRFLDMVPEDMRYLFEYIYGKPFTDADAVFLTGRV
jgi:hypothetical protein